MFPRERRNKKIKWFVAWGIVNAILCTYIMALLFIFWDAKTWAKDPCVKQLNLWLLVYCFVQGLHEIRSIAVIYIWHKANDPAVAQLKLELIYGGWVFILEACWIIYGNTFIYTEESQQCVYQPRWSILSTTTERNTVMVLIIYGYLLLLGMFLTMCFFIAFYFGYKSYIKTDLETVANRED